MTTQNTTRQHRAHRVYDHACRRCREQRSVAVMQALAGERDAATRALADGRGAVHTNAFGLQRVVAVEAPLDLILVPYGQRDRGWGLSGNRSRAMIANDGRWDDVLRQLGVARVAVA